MKKRSFKFLALILSLFAVIGITGFFVFQNIEKNLEALLVIEIEELDLSHVEDGIYRGSYQRTPIEVIIDVVVENHQITDIIIIKHDNGKGNDAELIIDDIILEQSLDVDLIAGATYSSKVILLAVNDALSN